MTLALSVPAARAEEPTGSNPKKPFPCLLRLWLPGPGCWWIPFVHFISPPSRLARDETGGGFTDVLGWEWCCQPKDAHQPPVPGMAMTRWPWWPRCPALSPPHGDKSGGRAGTELGTKGIGKPDPWNSGLCPDTALVLPEVTNIVFNPWHSPPGRASQDGITGRISAGSRQVCREKCLWRRKTPDPGMTIPPGWSCSSGKGFRMYFGVCVSKRAGEGAAGAAPGSAGDGGSMSARTLPRPAKFSRIHRPAEPNYLNLWH